MEDNIKNKKAMVIVEGLLVVALAIWVFFLK